MKILRFLKKNGLFLGFQVIYRKTSLLIYSSFLARKLNVRKLHIHPSAKIIGLLNIKVGENFHAGKDLWIEAVYSHGDITFNPQIIIKDNVAVNDSVHIAATNYVEIGNNVLMASKIYISDHNHGSYSGENQSDPEMPPNTRPVSCDKRVVIEDNVWLGEFVAVLSGVTIGRGCIIGSNSVVSKSIPPYSIAVGNPAIVVKRYNKENLKWETAQ
jgi:acetyltransferase-like isoleucine patch superfamily enzyme